MWGKNVCNEFQEFFLGHFSIGFLASARAAWWRALSMSGQAPCFPLDGVMERSGPIFRGILWLLYPTSAVLVFLPRNGRIGSRKFFRARANGPRSSTLS